MSPTSRIVAYLPLAIVLTAALMATGVRESSAQELNPRFGFGINGMLSSADGFGVGLRGRASAPINADLSFGADLGITAFVLGGRANADYIFDPQLSAIVSLPPTRSRLTYLLFGMGGYIPVSDQDAEAESGPTIHAGVGWVLALQETSLFYEINPALIIGEESVDVAVPFRIGVIF